MRIAPCGYAGTHAPHSYQAYSLYINAVTSGPKVLAWCPGLKPTGVS